MKNDNTGQFDSYSADIMSNLDAPLPDPIIPTVDTYGFPEIKKRILKIIESDRVNVDILYCLDKELSDYKEAIHNKITKIQIDRKKYKEGQTLIYIRHPNFYSQESIKIMDKFIGKPCLVIHDYHNYNDDKYMVQFSDIGHTEYNFFGETHRCNVFSANVTEDCLQLTDIILEPVNDIKNIEEDTDND